MTRPRAEGARRILPALARILPFWLLPLWIPACVQTPVRDGAPAVRTEVAGPHAPSPLEIVSVPQAGITTLGYEYGSPPNGMQQKLYYVPPAKAALYAQMIRDLFPDTPLVKEYTDLLRDPQAKDEKDNRIDLKGGADLLVLRGAPERISEIEDFLTTLETSHPQLEIEAIIAERVLSAGYAVGSQTSIIEADGDPDTFFDSMSSTFNTQAFLDSLLPGNLGGFQGGVFNLGTVHDEAIINSVLELLASNADTNIISTPKLRVMSGFRASIITGEEVPVQNVNISGGATVLTTEFKKTGSQLEITPVVVGDNTVRMLVRPEVSVVTSFTDPAVSGGVSNPIISTRNAETTVMLRSGDTLVLGGLDSDQTLEIESRVPVLGSIPFLGYFFSSRRSEKVRTRLLFFIKVTVSRAGAAVHDPVLLPTVEDLDAED